MADKQDETSVSTKKRQWYDRLCYWIFLALLAWMIIGLIVKFLGGN